MDDARITLPIVAPSSNYDYDEPLSNKISISFMGLSEDSSKKKNKPKK